MDAPASFMAALNGPSSGGTGQLLEVVMPDNGVPEEVLERTHDHDGVRYVTTWEREGDADGNIYPYVYRGVVAVPN